MATWVCNACTCRFSVGAARCPEPTCGARDAFEAGGNEEINVYETPPEVTAAELIAMGITERAEHAESLAAATVEANEMVNAAQTEVAERLGLLPGDEGAPDASDDPEPVNEDAVRS